MFLSFIAVWDAFHGEIRKRTAHLMQRDDANDNTKYIEYIEYMYVKDGT